MRSLIIALGILYGMLGQCVGQGLEGAKIFPMGGQRGAESSVELQGKNESWPPNAWSSHPGIVWKAREEKGKMLVTVAADAPIGLAFVRFFDSHSASSLLPFVVSGSSIFVEAEPNDAYGQPQMTSGADWFFHGILEKSGDVDHIGIPMRKGERWWFSLDANRSLRSPMDGSLQILDAKGNILAQNLDRFGLDPAIEWVCPTDGNISVRAFAFPETPDSTIGYAGGDTFRYLFHGTQGVDSMWEELQRDAVAITEPNDRSAPAIAGPASSPSPLAYWGSFETKGDEDAIVMETVQAGHWRVAARSLELGSDADLVLEIIDANGKSIAKQGESGEIRDPVLRDQMKAPGKYTIVVRDLHRAFGERHRYRIELVDERPSVTGSIAKDVFIGEIGKPIEIEIAVERTLECADEATVRLEGLPEGVVSEPVISRGGDDSAKKVVLKVTASQPCSIPVRVRIEQAGRTEADYATSGPHRQPHLWLIVKPAQ
jgi:hypothetical protein